MAQPIRDIIHESTNHQRVEIPIRPERIQKELGKQKRQGEIVDVFAYGQHRGSEHIAAFHYGVGYEYPQDGTQEAAQRFADIEQIAGDNEEAGHMEGIYHVLSVWVCVADIDEMERNHQQDEYAFHIVELFYSFLHLFYFGNFGRIIFGHYPKRNDRLGCIGTLFSILKIRLSV